MIINRLQILAKTSLVCVFLVVIAGSLVRTTGSGMGCPDWPKCFGYYIPPTQLSELIFQPEKEYKKGQIIIVDKTLKVCTIDFTSAKEFNTKNWGNYTKHNYAVFNSLHTWVEYINRLIGAITGIPILLLFFTSLFMWRKNKKITILCASVLILLGIVAWMGKLVVDGNLIPNQITLHMLGAILLVFLLIVIINQLNFLKAPTIKTENLSRKISVLVAISVGLTLFQIILGTKVREQVDFIDRQLLLDRNLWVENLNYFFYLHRSFAWLVLLLNGYIVFKLFISKEHRTFIQKVSIVLLSEILVGVVLNYFEIPKYLQPVHLFLAFLLFGLQSNFILKFKIKRLVL
jgi:heme a synthase